MLLYLHRYMQNKRASVKLSFEIETGIMHYGRRRTQNSTRRLDTVRNYSPLPPAMEAVDTTVDCCASSLSMLSVNSASNC